LRRGKEEIRSTRQRVKKLRKQVGVEPFNYVSIAYTWNRKEDPMLLGTLSEVR